MSKLNVAVLMDPVSELNVKKDTTLALINAAMKLGHEVKIFTPQDWFWQGQEVWAQLSSLTQQDSTWCSQVCSAPQPLTDFHVILMRQNPPVHTEYMYATYALEHAQRAGVYVSNHPQAVRDLNEKFSIIHFPELISPTLITRDMQRLREFWSVHRDVVYKPLDAYGGASVFHVDETEKNLNVILEVLTQQGARTIMAQRYIPEIKDSGDKRILMIHGEPVPYALARMPSKSDWRGNLAAGATGKVVPLTARDKEICAALSPFLKAKGLHFVGLDVIGNYLTEINVTSPTCLCEIEKETGLELAKQFWMGTALWRFDRYIDLIKKF